MPFNPYFDNMNEIWLECRIDYKSDNTFDVIYQNGYDKSLDEKLWNKYETHLNVYKLNETFSSRACDEIESCKGLYQNLLYNCGRDEVQNSLPDCRRSCELNDLNSWRSSLYRELERNYESYCDWLDDN